MKKIIYVFSLVLVLLFAGCTSSRPSNPATPHPSGGSSVPVNCDDQCVAMTGSTKTLCYAGCYEQQAGKTGDASVCENIKTRESGEGVNYIACLEQAGIKLNSTATCDRIENVSLRDVCYFGLQPAILDPTTCPKLSNPDKQEICRNMHR